MKYYLNAKRLILQNAFENVQTSMCYVIASVRKISPLRVNICTNTRLLRFTKSCWSLWIISKLQWHEYFNKFWRFITILIKKNVFHWNFKYISSEKNAVFYDGSFCDVLPNIFQTAMLLLPISHQYCVLGEGVVSITLVSRFEKYFIYTLVCLLPHRCDLILRSIMANRF